MKETENSEKVGATVDVYEVEKSAHRVVVLIKKEIRRMVNRLQKSKSYTLCVLCGFLLAD
jgi:hypothetical protein